jgi:hypothetical protein
VKNRAADHDVIARADKSARTGPVVGCSTA